MDSFTIELVSKASGELLPDNTLSSFTNFLPEQVILEGQWEVSISEMSYPSMYQNLTQRKFKCFDEKVFRLHAILHDAAGAVRSHSGKGPGYCHMIVRGPNSCLLGYVTGLFFCLYVKLFLPSIFNFVDF